MVGAIRGHSAVPELTKQLSDKRANVREQVLKTLMLLEGSEFAVPSLLKELEVSKSVSWSTQIINALASIADPAAAEAFMRVLKNENSAKMTQAAIVGLQKVLWVESVPLIVKQLTHRKSGVRNAAYKALHYITNHRMGRGKAAVRKWSKWLDKYGKEGRIAWVKRGFESRYKIRLAKKPKKAIKQLIKLIYTGGAAALNAMAVIKELTGFSMKRAHFSDRQMYRFYMTWLRDGMPTGNSDGSTIPSG